VLTLNVENWIKTARLENADECTGCSLCFNVCPFDAISMVAPSALMPKLDTSAL
jgi:Fe-S-cluster-containing hydrogenase component 2